MMNRIFFFSIFICLIFPYPGLHASSTQEGIWAKIITSKGNIKTRLYYKKAPMTVMNFIGLADGSKEWVDPVTQEKKNGIPLYKNLTFHRVVEDFVVQTGDPLGTGKGGPGYHFMDEFHPDLRHDQAGILSMANRGPHTNGSQFFITKTATQWLDNFHTVFGKVEEGFEVINRLEQDDQLVEVQIERKGSEAISFDVAKAHEYAEKNANYFRQLNAKVLPEKFGKLDPKKKPAPEQEIVQPGDFEFILLGFQGVNVPGKVFYYDHKEILQIATKIVRYARSENVNFSELIKKYSDLKQDNRFMNRKITPHLPALMHNIFRLRSGQISDPIDTPRGVYIFHRL